MAETVFSKPLDGEVASLNDAITKLTELTVTPGSNISLASWGRLKAYKIGRLLILIGVGVKASAASGILCTISGITFSMYQAGTGVAEGTNDRSFIMTASDTGNANVVQYDDLLNTNSNMYFEFVAIVN